MSKLILCLLLLFNIYVCTDTPDHRIFTQDDAANELNVRFGEEFYLKLKTNPSTGYSWTFLNQAEIDDTLTLLRTYSENPQLNSEKPLIGAGGFRYYHFKAVKKTKEPVSIKLSYSKSYISSNSPTTTFKVNVN